MEIPQTENLTDAAKTFAHYLRGRAGGYATSLLDAWSKADLQNRALLAYAYPKLYASMRDYNASSDKELWIQQNS